MILYDLTLQTSLRMALKLLIFSFFIFRPKKELPQQIGDQQLQLTNQSQQQQQQDQVFDFEPGPSTSSAIITPTPVQVGAVTFLLMFASHAIFV